MCHGDVSFQSSLRDSGRYSVSLPSDKSLGYYQSSLRDEQPTTLSCNRSQNTTDCTDCELCGLQRRILRVADHTEQKAIRYLHQVTSTDAPNDLATSPAGVVKLMAIQARFLARPASAGIRFGTATPNTGWADDLGPMTNRQVQYLACR